MTRLPVRGLALAALLLLAGCVGGGRADLYRFGSASAPATKTPATATTALMVVSYPGSRFSPPASGDRILTINGVQASYIAKARWVSSAPELFDAAAIEAFETRAPGLRLISHDDLARAPYLLLIDVPHFEALYTGGEKAPPEIMVESRARLVRRADRAIVAEWDVRRTEPAAENRVGAIVSAFDRATAGVINEIADHARQTIPALPPG